MNNVPTSWTAVNHSLDALAPKVKDAANRAITKANAAGYHSKAYETLRMPERQDYLYTLGRSVPGKIVTNREGWESAHQFGVALDSIFWVNNDWSWQGNFFAVSKFFIAEGFEWLHPFEEAHFQMCMGWSTAKMRLFIQKDMTKLPDLWAAMGLT